MCERYRTLSIRILNSTENGGGARVGTGIPLEAGTGDKNLFDGAGSGDGSSGNLDGDRRGASALVESTRLLLSDAKRSAVRRKQLYEAGAISLSELEDAALTLERLEKEYKRHKSAEDSAAALESGLRRTARELQTKGSELVVKSPIRGILLELPAEKDGVLQPGDLVVTVAPTAKIEVVSDILSDTMGEVAVGQKARVTAPVLGSQVLEGRVAKIYPQAFEKLSALGVVQRRVRVKINLPFDQRLKPGFEVRIAIEMERHDGALLLPIEAVRTTEKGDLVVLRVVQGRIRKTLVRTGLADRRSPIRGGPGGT